MFKQYRKTETHVAIVDVACTPEDAIKTVREILPPKYGKVTLHSAAGPSGCPQVAVRLMSKRMAKFLKDWYPDEHVTWVSEQARPPLPHHYFV